MSADEFYTTQLQAGLGMVSECVSLLRLHQSGGTSSQLSQIALAEGVFPGCTARRVENLVREMFAPRFYKPDSQVADRIQEVISSGTHIDVIKQIFLIHTTRAQLVLRDFITQVYWQHARLGDDSLTIDHARRFLEEALRQGKMAKSWSPTTINRVSGYLLGACHDFDLLGAACRGLRPFLHFRIRAKTAIYLAHDLHFSGMGDQSLVLHPDWSIFGLESPDEVVGFLASISSEARWLIQSGGGLVQISWNNPTWKEALLAITR